MLIFLRATAICANGSTTFEFGMKFFTKEGDANRIVTFLRNVANRKRVSLPAN